ncbi:hypothetical protein [Anaerocolumna chitinilytica]|uniref:Uncharacterized protein n=1 Tax=Anaerocolumna chitinilytica TaxID=1727145 RepID=A0A7I8DIM3_9FIRM|nr:hypothetical protein [Anaerocolumna chitinilytica]BCJ98200.1 hypothetical protein bsdcttw_12410 [Anaerocolumna chitinilytica]
MKYLEYDLWMDTNSDEENTRLTALKKWEENAACYVGEYIQTKKYLSKAFIKTYEDNFGYRGCFLTDILLSSNSKNKSDTEWRNLPICKILLSDLIDIWQLTYYGLELLEYHPATGKKSSLALTNGYLSLEFSELLQIKEDKFSHELLFSNGSSLLIHFTKISAKKIHQP